MRHAKRNQRLSLPSSHRQALVNGMVRNLVLRGQIRTTFARAKEAQRVAEHLVTLGKEGSIHSRRQAFGVLQNRTLVKQLFTDIAPRFVDVAGGYTRLVRLSRRQGDGAQQALLALSRLPATQPAAPSARAPLEKPSTPTPSSPQKTEKGEEPEKPKGFFEGLRTLWTRRKKG